MLVATPGQTATYATGPTAKKVTTLSSSTNANNLASTSKALNSAGTTSINANNNKNLNNSKSSTGHNNSFTFNTLKNVFITNSNVRENIPTTITTTPTVAAASSIDNSSSEVIPVNSNSSKTAASSLMKSLTVRLNRGTETLKATVHKALITATAVSSIIERKTITEAITTKLATTTTATNISNIASLKTSNVINTSASTSASSSAATLLATAHKCPSATFLKLYAVPPTIIHRLPSEREQTSSTDSLNKEMCHFKPIRTAPTTPWKSGSKSRGVSLRFPKANVATNPEFSKKSNCDVINRKEDKNRDMNHDRNPNENLKPKPSSSTLLLTRLLATPNHQSAFVCLVAQMEQLTKKHTNLDNHSPHVRNVSDLRKTEADFKRPRDVPSRVTRVQKRRSNSILPNANVTNEMLINKLKHRPATAEVTKESIKSPHHTRIHNTRTFSRSRGGSAGITNIITNADTSAAIAAATAALNNAGIKTRTTVKVTASASRAAAKDVNATTTTATLSIIQKPKPKILDLVKLAQHSRFQSKLPPVAAAKQTKSATVSSSDSQSSSKRRRARKRKLLNDGPEPVTAVKIRVMPTRSNAGVQTSARRNTSAAKVSKDRSAKNLRANSDVMFKKLKEKETERRAVIGKTNPMQKKSVTSQRPSPPLTRSRLKEMQLNEAKRA